MKRILTTAVLAVSMSTAWAQAPAPQVAQTGTKPAEVAKSEAQHAAQADSAKPVAVKKPNPRRHEDARHCLEKSSNLEIIKCAEVYL